MDGIRRFWSMGYRLAATNKPTDNYALIVGVVTLETNLGLLLEVI